MAAPPAQIIGDSMFDSDVHDNQGHSFAKEFDLNYVEQSGVNHTTTNHKECQAEQSEVTKDFVSKVLEDGDPGMTHIGLTQPRNPSDGYDPVEVNVMIFVSF